MRKAKETERVVDLYIGSLDGFTLVEIENLFDRFANDYNVFPETIELNAAGYSDNDYQLMGIREETLTEKARRETAERRRRIKAGERKKAKEDAERREYERLKKKFGES